MEDRPEGWSPVSLDRETMLEALRGCPEIKIASESCLSSLVEKAKAWQLSPGAFFCRGGQKSAIFAVVVSGELVISRSTPNRRNSAITRRELRVFGPGASVGWSVAAGRKPSADVQVRRKGNRRGGRPAVILALASDDLKQAVADEPQVLWAVVSRMAQLIEVLSQDLERNLELPAKVRIAYQIALVLPPQCDASPLVVSATVAELAARAHCNERTVRKFFEACEHVVPAEKRKRKNSIEVILSNRSLAFWDRARALGSEQRRPAKKG